MLLKLRYFSLLVICSFLFSSSLCFAANIEKLADDDWLHLQSSNFELVTDLNEEKARHLIEDLEAYRYFSIQIMGLHVVDSVKPLKLLAISSNSNFRKLDLPDTWAGVFSMNLLGYAAIANVNGYSTNTNVNTFGRQVLLHEYNHFLVRFTQETRIYPTWYDEGYAEYWGTFKFTDSKISIGSASSIEFRAGDLFTAAGDLEINTEKLFKATKYPEGKEAIGRFYAQSFFLVHYFNSSPELRAQLHHYMDDLNVGYSEDQALSKAFGFSYSDLDKKVKKYVSSNLKMLVLNATSGSLKFPKPEVSVAVMDKPAFYRFTAEVLSVFGEFKDDTKRQLLQETIRLNPQYAPAKSLLLMLNLAEEPKKIIDELEQQAPSDPLFLTYKARGLQNQAQMLHAAGADNWLDTVKQARSLFRRALKADNSMGTAYSGLGDLYSYLPVTEPLKEGAVCLETASLFDRDENTFAKLALLYVRQSNSSGALVAARNAVAFGKSKVAPTLILLLDNLELANSLNSQKGKPTDTGLHYDDGVVYTGALVNGNPDGVGKLVRPNGSYYQGNFTNGVMNGQGKLVSYNGMTYEGNFQNGVARGKAIITYPEGFELKSYEGETEFTYPNGKGILVSNAGSYEGEFWYSQSQGQGVFVSANTKTKLQGRWIEGRYEWPEVNGVQFVGAINAMGQRDGNGVCKIMASRSLEWCSFKENIQQKDTQPAPVKK